MDLVKEKKIKESTMTQIFDLNNQMKRLGHLLTWRRPAENKSRVCFAKTRACFRHVKSEMPMNLWTWFIHQPLMSLVEQVSA